MVETKLPLGLGMHALAGISCKESVDFVVQ